MTFQQLICIINFEDIYPAIIMLTAWLSIPVLMLMWQLVEDQVKLLIAKYNIMQLDIIFLQSVHTRLTFRL